jgi:hypothetical protein
VGGYADIPVSSPLPAVWFSPKFGRGKVPQGLLPAGHFPKQLHPPQEFGIREGL